MFEPEAAAAQVEDTALRGLSANALGESVKMSPACLLHLEQPCFPENSQMLGDVVVRSADSLGNRAHVERGVDQESNNPNSCLLSQRLERNDARRIERRDARSRPTVQLYGL